MAAKGFSILARAPSSSLPVASSKALLAAATWEEANSRALREPKLEVIIMMALVKLTVRPRASVRRPSSKTCKKRSKTSGWAFSTSSKSKTQKGLVRTALVS